MLKLSVFWEEKNIDLQPKEINLDLSRMEWFHISWKNMYFFAGGNTEVVWFLCLIAYQLFLGYLMPKPFS